MVAQTKVQSRVVLLNHGGGVAQSRPVFFLPRGCLLLYRRETKARRGDGELWAFVRKSAGGNVDFIENIARRHRRIAVLAATVVSVRKVLKRRETMVFTQSTAVK